MPNVKKRPAPAGNRGDGRAPAARAAGAKHPPVRIVPIADLKPAPYNPRIIGEDALAGLAASLERFGVVEPIVWNQRTHHVVGGHQRLQVLKKRGDQEAQVVVVDLDETEEKKLNLTLNNPHIAGEFTDDAQTLLRELADQNEESFTDLLLDRLLNAADDDAVPAAADSVPGVPAKAKTRKGDLWILGQHRLLCGDSTDEKNIKRLFKSDRAACVFTDPPYGVSYEDRGGKFGMIKNDELRDDGLVKLLLPALRLAVKVAVDEAGFYIWHASSTREDFSYAMKSAGLVERQYLIWAKNGFSLGWSDYRWSHEPCFYASKAERKPTFHGDAAQSTIWRVSSVIRGAIATTLGPGLVVTDGDGNKLFIQGTAPTTKKVRTARVAKGDKIWISAAELAGTVWEVSRETEMVHPTQKPAELAIRALKNSSLENEIVYDPFLGSGTTLIGAELTGRRCYGCELDPKYADVIVKRWEDLTNQKAHVEAV